MNSLPDFSLEKEYWKKEYHLIGIDEVGRGCLAGPVTVGAVYLNPHVDTEEWLSYRINDSKKMTPTNRETIAKIITAKSSHAVAFMSPQMINEIGIVACILEGIAETVYKIKKSLPDKKILLLIDGLPISHIPCINDIPRVSVVKGDNKSISIAAASVVAKVKRDSYMKTLCKQFPNYNWEENKGYGTLKHRLAIKRFGVSSQHRTQFVRNVLHSI